MSDAYFFDSSAITKRYYREQGTSWVQAICTKRVRPIIYLSDIARVEVAVAIRKAGRLNGDPAPLIESLIKLYRRHIARSRLGNNGPYIFVPVIDDVIVTAGYLADRFVNPPNILRSMDAIQLASALLVSRAIADRLVFVTSDAKLEAMAQAISLGTENPMRHP